MRVGALRLRDWAALASPLETRDVCTERSGLMLPKEKRIHMAASLKIYG